MKAVPTILAAAMALPGLGQAAQEIRSATVPIQTSQPHSTPLDLQQGAERSTPTGVPSQSRYSREAWGLSEPEWARYLQLMQGIRGSVSQGNISPLEVLGIHAETDRERHDYARRIAEMMKEDADRVLAFSRAYSEEAAKLNAGMSIVDKALLQLAANQKEEPIQPGDRLLLFTRIRECPECERYVSAAAEAATRTGAQLDIYFHDARKDDDIHSWVGSHGLDAERIKAKRITVNYHRGELNQVAGVAATIPKLIRLRGATAVSVDPSLIN